VRGFRRPVGSGGGRSWRKIPGGRLLEGHQQFPVALVGEDLCSFAQLDQRISSTSRSSEPSPSGVITQYAAIFRRSFRSRYSVVPTNETIRQRRPAPSSTREGGTSVRSLSARPCPSGRTNPPGSGDGRCDLDAIRPRLADDQAPAAQDQLRRPIVDLDSGTPLFGQSGPIPIGGILGWQFRPIRVLGGSRKPPPTCPKGQAHPARGSLDG